jgi:hypothetical protein
MTTRNFVPRENCEGNIGTFLLRWLKGWFSDLFVAGTITDGTNDLTVAEIKNDITTGTQLGIDVSNHVVATITHGTTGIIVGTTDEQTLTNKTLTIPIVENFTNAIHNHSNIINGGTISHAILLDKGTNTHPIIDIHLDNISNPHIVTKTQVGLSNVTNETQIPLTQKGSINGVAELDASGKLAISQLPPLAISTTSIVNSEMEQLALIAQSGDVAIRMDEYKSYINNGGTTGTMADWAALLSPTGTMISVFGRIGIITAENNDYTWNQINKTVSNIADITTKSHTALTDKGINTHEQIDTAIVTTLPNLVTTHTNLTTGIHGVGASTVASIANIAAHASLSVTHDATGAIVGTTNVQTLLNKTLTTPTISNFTNANHTHINTVQGGKNNIAQITSGTYDGNGVGGRAIAHGLSVIPKFIRTVDNDGRETTFIIPGYITYHDDNTTVTSWNNTNFYLGHNDDGANRNGRIYNWVAFG